MARTLSILCIHGVAHGDADALLAPSWTDAITTGIRRSLANLSVRATSSTLRARTIATGVPAGASGARSREYASSTSGSVCTVLPSRIFSRSAAHAGAGRGPPADFPPSGAAETGDSPGLMGEVTAGSCL